MITDPLRQHFLMKADYSHIDHVLESEGFVYTREDVESMMRGNQKGTRYGSMVLPRVENGQERKQFLKVMIDGSLRTFKAFRREVKVVNTLQRNPRLASSVIRVVKYSLNRRVPYAIFETRDNGANFGFMDDAPSYYQEMSAGEIRSLAESIYAFHNAGGSIDKRVWRHTQSVSSDPVHYEAGIRGDLSVVVSHKTVDGEMVRATTEELLERYTGISSIGDRIVEVFRENWKHTDNSPTKNKYYLVHGDMQIDNVYRNENGSFELLDFEWAGKTGNPVIAIMYDYGSLRARAWSSPAFQSALDEAMTDVGEEYYDDPVTVSAGLALGSLRFSLMMCRFYLDFPNTVKHDRHTEEEYQEMYPKTITSLVGALETYGGADAQARA